LQASGRRPRRALPRVQLVCYERQVSRHDCRSCWSPSQA
jgi:hypothetical protein